MRRIVIILFLMMLIGTASAVSTLYLLPFNASEPMPNAKQSADTIHRDVATSRATYLVPGVMSETVSSIQGIPTTAQSTAAEAGAVHYTHYGTWISNPLAAQWVNGTVTVALVMQESSSSANVNPRLKIYRWYANDTKGAELRAIGNSATEVPTAYPASPVTYFNAVALTNTSFEEGDRIAVELESYDNNAVTTSWLHGIRYGSISGGNMSYVRFSQNLTYLPPKTIPVYTGQRPINTNLTSISDPSVRSVAVADEMYKNISKYNFPINYTDGVANISIKAISYDLTVAKWGVWISATRDGKEVHTHSPIWIVNSPYEVMVSSSTDTIKNEEIITLKESPLEAAQQVLAGYVSRQPLGIAEGDDVLIVYLSEDTADGYMSLVSTGGDTWTNIRNGAGTLSGDGGTAYLVRVTSKTNSEVYASIYRLGYGFNTSEVGSGSTVTNTVFGISVHAKQNGLGSDGLGITGFAPTIVNDFALGDYDNFGITRYASDIAYADVPQTTGTGYTNFTFWSNATQYINKTGYTNLMLRLSSDIDNTNSSLVFASAVSTGYRIDDYTVTAGNYPFLEITYTPAAGGSAPVSSFTLQKPLYRIPGIMQANDTSTNTPTQWNWSWGDGTWTNGTTQNATHKYTTRGKFGVTLLTSNAFGSNTTPTATNVRIVGYENLW